ncbi:hypothetical protein SCLCIDRAFT_12194 [Scleroderma citrinum Foug A]|uniref:NAD(P)-binding protein n=1 Tax=Scleroderma citrinum Foug A TaxID=1036808 RepID=A0A0C2ZE19_9AGAM|nr:hypothetical protein SCLCIDRAFT_12194 [Scleroderma citrinum Foug A]
MGSSASKAFNPEQDIPDLTGKVIIVTGGNTGIGYATIKHLTRKGAKVYMAARNKARAGAAISALHKEGLGPGNGEVVWLELDLSDPRNAKKAAKEFMAKEDRLDVLIHNAAIMFGPYEILPDGVQEIMVVNVISPFVLTRELLPALKKTASQSDSDVRVVTVSSEGHRTMGAVPRFRTIEDLNDECNHSLLPIFMRYCLSKTANILYASELHRRLSSDPSSSNIIALSLHPGQVNSFYNRPWVVRLHLSGVVYVLGLPTTVMPDVGAYTSVFAAAAPVVKREWEKYGGRYVMPVGKVVKPTVGLWKGVMVGRKEVTVGEEWEKEWVEAGKELWEVIERFLEERGI